MIEAPDREHVTLTFEARALTAATVGDVGFQRKDVSAVIQALDFNRGTLPVAFQLPAWRRVDVAGRPEKGKPSPPSRQSIGAHLSTDDLRATVFEDPALTVDYARATAHVRSCETCRGMVERERTENPLAKADDGVLPVAADQ